MEATATVSITPVTDPGFLGLQAEIIGIVKDAELRVVASPEDAKHATNDLSLMKKLKTALEDKRKEYVVPLQDYTKEINTTFKLLSEPLATADAMTRRKMLDYHLELERIRAEAAELERKKAELAAQEKALKGEVSPELSTPAIDVPAAPPQSVRAEAGLASTKYIKKWELEDITKVPEDYKELNSALITKVVKSGIPSIPGIRIYEEPILQIRPE